MASRRFDLSDDEVVVLNSVIYAITERDDFAVLVADPADRQALHNLLAVLEREDSVAFSDDYKARVEQARQRLLPRQD